MPSLLNNRLKWETDESVKNDKTKCIMYEVDLCMLSKLGWDPRTWYHRNESVQNSTLKVSIHLSFRYYQPYHTVKSKVYHIGS